MKLLFIQGGSRLKQSKEGNLYIDGNFSIEVWNRYLTLCDELVIILRKENAVYEDEYAKKKFNKMPVDSKIHIIGVTDVYQPLTNFFNPIIHCNIRKVIYREVKKVDKVIIRSSSFYSGIAYNACRKYKKPYMFECTGFALESFRYHSLLGRITAPYFENLCKRISRDAHSVIYVTDKALQQRYPCLSGRMLGCSDVYLKEQNPEILTKRLLRIKACKKPLILGTAAFLDVHWKGQYLVIKDDETVRLDNYKHINQKLNETSIVIDVGGSYDENTILPTTVSTIWYGGETSKKIYNNLKSIMKRYSVGLT